MQKILTWFIHISKKAVALTQEGFRCAQQSDCTASEEVAPAHSLTALSLHEERKIFPFLTREDFAVCIRSSFFSESLTSCPLTPPAGGHLLGGQ